ncbi:DUF4395 domain-containing protein [Mucilaginibacter conchicola]|uniref:DUF4395 domain-containing protein n=1 Tax=Mucilaginibacter conchicola TaxID=2303333 RepID=A0A372NPT4_9SPHI|nr:DUF4395 domain-containing protein [Mucilaginibacter conchicola]RFZ90949.1 DUF4395 domain-containing protein [Mucilaginibacter conchicola]
MQSKLECPIDGVKVDETRVRVVAFFVILFAVAVLVTGNPVLPAILLFDFALRGLNLQPYSPLALIAGQVVKLLNLKSKLTDRGPKRFAALMGAIFSAIILTLLLFGLVLEAKIVTSVLLVFAGLESFAGFCAGCYVYTWMKAFKAG